MRRLWTEHGVPLVSGTDAVSTFGDYSIGPNLMVEAGMSTMDAVMPSTSVAARAVGVDDLVGTLEPGKEADLVIVDRDPLMDVTALGSVRLVMLSGTVVHQGPTAAGPSREALT